MNTVAAEDRQKLAELIDPIAFETGSTWRREDALQRADAVIAAGWRPQYHYTKRRLYK